MSSKSSMDVPDLGKIKSIFDVMKSRFNSDVKLDSSHIREYLPGDESASTTSTSDSTESKNKMNLFVDNLFDRLILEIIFHCPCLLHVVYENKLVTASKVLKFLQTKQMLFAINKDNFTIAYEITLNRYYKDNGNLNDVFIPEIDCWSIILFFFCKEKKLTVDPILSTQISDLLLKSDSDFPHFSLTLFLLNIKRKRKIGVCEHSVPYLSSLRRNRKLDSKLGTKTAIQLYSRIGNVEALKIYPRKLMIFLLRDLLYLSIIAPLCWDLLARDIYKQLFQGINLSLLPLKTRIIYDLIFYRRRYKNIPFKSILKLIRMDPVEIQYLLGYDLKIYQPGESEMINLLTEVDRIGYQKHIEKIKIMNMLRFEYGIDVFDPSISGEKLIKMKNVLVSNKTDLSLLELANEKTFLLEEVENHLPTDLFKIYSNGKLHVFSRKALANMLKSKAHPYTKEPLNPFMITRITAMTYLNKAFPEPKPLKETLSLWNKYDKDTLIIKQDVLSVKEFSTKWDQINTGSGSLSSMLSDLGSNVFRQILEQFESHHDNMSSNTGGMIAISGSGPTGHSFFESLFLGLNSSDNSEDDVD